MINTHRQLVQKFVHRAGQPVYTKSDVKSLQLQAKHWDWLKSVLNEEHHEYLIAWGLHEKSPEKSAHDRLDALIDLAYFTHSFMVMFAYHVKETTTGLKEALDSINSSHNEINDLNLSKIINSCYHQAQKLTGSKTNLDSAFKRVHRANMCKFPNSRLVAMQSLKTLREKHPTAQMEETINHFRLYKNIGEIRRILKPNGWQSPNLSKYLKPCK